MRFIAISKNVSALYRVTGIFIGTAIALALTVLATRSSPCFLILAKKSDDDKKLILKRLFRKYWAVAGSLVVSLFVGVAGNYLYSYLATKLV